MRVFVTGSAGFIGMHVTSKFLEAGHEVVTLDSLNSSYDSSLTRKRCEFLYEKFNHKVHVADINSLNEHELLELIGESELLIHLAAWPGVRLGQEMPLKYSLNNVGGFSKIIGAVHTLSLPKFFFASSSSVYGDLGIGGPVKESDATGGNLRSHYAVNKWINELEARSYATLGSTSMVALRFFTVYGPWGRPDMAYWIFLKKMLSGSGIDLYGENGGMRNFTYIDDLANIMLQLALVKFTDKFQALNIASGAPLETIQMLLTLQKISGVKDLAISRIDRPSADVTKTWANLDKLDSLISLPAATSIDDGLKDFSNWYRSFCHET